MYSSDGDAQRLRDRPYGLALLTARQDLCALFVVDDARTSADDPAPLCQFYAGLDPPTQHAATKFSNFLPCVQDGGAFDVSTSSDAFEHFDHNTLFKQLVEHIEAVDHGLCQVIGFHDHEHIIWPEVI